MAISFTLEPKHTALLVMDYQNEIFTSFGEASSGLLNRAASILEATRNADVPIIYFVVRFREGYPEINPRNPSFARIVQSGTMHEGAPVAEIHPRCEAARGGIQYH